MFNTIINGLTDVVSTPIGSLLFGAVILGIAAYRLRETPTINAPVHRVLEGCFFATAASVFLLKPFALELFAVLAPFNSTVAIALPAALSSVALLCIFAILEAYATSRGPITG